MSTIKQRINESKRILFVGTQPEADRINALNIAGLYAVFVATADIKTANFSSLVGKETFIWRAYNQTGEQFEQRILDAIKPFADSVSAVKVDALELDVNQNIIDYLKKSKGNKESELASVELNLSDVEILHGTKAVEKMIEDSISGDFQNINFPGMPKLSDLSKSLLPGTVTTICGAAGSGKSFFNIQNVWRWVCEENLNVKVLMLEDTQAMHQSRALAQMSETSGMTDAEFIRNNPEAAREHIAENKDKLARFAQALECSRTGQMTLDEIAEWIARQIKSGAEIIIVDPITAAKQQGAVWENDMIFLFKVKQVVERSGAKLILFSHPRTGKAGEMNLSGIAGGAAYPRFSQTVIWIKNSEESIESDIIKAGETISVTHRQVFKILKSRNGKGFGLSIAADLCPYTSKMDEFGLIAKKKKTEKVILEAIMKPKVEFKIETKSVKTSEEFPVLSPFDEAMFERMIDADSPFA